MHKPNVPSVGEEEPDSLTVPDRDRVRRNLDPECPEIEAVHTPNSALRPNGVT